MKNRKLLLIVSLVLALTMSLGGTLAYLTDTDADVNTMVLGNVKITQNEQQWNADKTELVEFEQDKPLLPYVGELGWENKEQENGAYRRFTMSNVVDKYVTVTNTGNTDAYVRTIIALEMGNYTSIDEYLYNIVGTSRNADNPEGKGEFDFEGAWLWDEFYTTQIDGKNYLIMTATHQNALEPKATTIPSLLQVYVNKACDNEHLTNLDGNENGKLDILVISQAVQADGFADANTALSEAFPYGSNKATTVADWFASIGDPDSDYQIGTPGEDWPNNNPPANVDEIVDTDAELLAAIQDPSVTTIAVDGDLTYDWGRNSYENSKALLMAGKTFVGVDDEASITFKGYGSANPIKNVTLSNIIIKGETVGDDEGSWEHGHLEFEDLKATDVVFADTIMLDGTCELVNCTFENNTSSWYAAWVDGGDASFKNCTFTGTRGIKIHEAYGSEVNSVVVDNCSFTLSEKPGVVIGNLNANTSVTIKNSAFATTAGDQNKYFYETDTTVSTFNFVETNNSRAINVASAEALLDYSAVALTSNDNIAETAIINITADIDMQGKEFSAIIAQRGDKLVINGNGHTISNVRVVSGANDNTTGQASMFYAYSNSTLEVSDLTLKNVMVVADEADSGYAAAVIGYCEGTAILKNVDVINATVTGVKSSGMLVGHMSGTLTATDCNVSGTVTLAEYADEPNGHYAGKYIGTLAGNATLTNCTANVTVSGNLKTGNDGDVYGRTVSGSLTVN